MSARRRPAGRRRAALAAVLALSLVVAGAGGTAAAAAPRASLTQIENDVMCVICHESLALSQSPQAMQEREYIRSLIAQGKTRRQIENDLVQQYGPAVLALPPAQGFNLLVYIVPPLLLGFGLVVLALTIPKWRRRARAAAAGAAGPGPPAATLDPADARRLDEDLGRFA